MFTACFIVWQLGVLFYAGTTMSLFGGTPFPLAGKEVLLIIGAGYLVSIAFICLFPRKTVYAERAVLPAAFAAAALTLFPFSPEVLTILFYIEIFCCTFSIGTMASLASHLFTVDTTWRDAIIGLAAGGVLIAALQNDLFPVGFTAFTSLSLVMIAALSLFHFLIPAKIRTPYAGADHRVKMPGILFWGTWMLNAFSTLLLCLASSFSESLPHGVSIFYLSGGAFALLAGYLKKRRGGYSLKIFGTYFMLAVVGFILAAFSPQIPQTGPFACILLGFVAALANFWIFFCAVAFHFYPTRFIGAMGAAQGLLLALIHSGLLEALRNDPPLLYGLYAILAALMMLCCYLLEPYFTHAWAQSKKADETPSAGDEKKESPFGALSEQERILADLILRGYTESAIAKEMNITLNTQKSYRKNLYAKLDLHSKRELFELANK
ncbi:MAG: helix-turn-helix transcriptional regulator [Bacillota bacterium]|nr:helix-turn-helix transcriptional regulator [Bacillota bacterium]